MAPLNASIAVDRSPAAMAASPRRIRSRWLFSRPRYEVAIDGRQPAEQRARSGGARFTGEILAFVADRGTSSGQRVPILHRSSRDSPAVEC